MHPFADLSAYLDGALGPEGRAKLDAHLVTCALCRTRLEELRSTARLISALPMLAPSRSLVPRVSIPIWMAPLRTLSTIASGAALFLFIASALVSSLSGAQSAGSAPAAAPAPNAPNVTTVDNSRSGAGGATATTSDQRTVLGASPTPAPPPIAFGPADRTPSAAPSASSSDAGKFLSSPAAEVSRQDSATSSSADQHTASAPPRAQLGLSPWVWLALAIGFGALAILLGRRLRAA